MKDLKNLSTIHSITNMFSNASVITKAPRIHGDTRLLQKMIDDLKSIMK